MGLLKKVNENKISLAVLDTQSNSDISSNKKKNQIDIFLSDVKKLKTGFEYSNDLFSSLSLLLNISKGALLVKEPESGTFIPTSFTNIDITTTRHLRINCSIFDEQFNCYNEIINISNNKIRIFKQYLSIREFSALSSIILVPLYFRGALSALLIIIDPLDKLVSIVKEISINSEKFTSKLLKSRKPFNNLKSFSNSGVKPEPVKVLQNYIDNNKSKDITYLIITINFSNLRNYLIKLLPNIESFDISKNIVKSITQLISPSGKLLEIDSETYILFYYIRKGKTSGIILHQINLAISSFFNISDSLPEIDAEIQSFPGTELKSAETMLEGII